jgi:hypothetical protein
MKIKKIVRFAALLGVVSLAAGSSVPRAWGGGWCRIWCDNGIAVQGDSSSFEECQASFAGNCNQQGTYGGTFCYEGSPCQTY